MLRACAERGRLLTAYLEAAEGAHGAANSLSLLAFSDSWQEYGELGLQVNKGIAVASLARLAYEHHKLDHGCWLRPSAW
jgi:hypothetical protein